MVPASALIYCLQSSHIHTVASSYRQVFFVLGVGGGRADLEFSSDQVSPKKEIPTEPKPKRWAAGWGLQGLDTAKEMLMWLPGPERKPSSWCWTLLTSHCPRG